ncbi:MAG: Ig-like domain-containing protein, partial [Acidobacteriota bacterium]|nr:Ig-like domain-containing protein [Acidobacteriota bacterium]
TVTANDGATTGSTSFTWTVENVNRYPVLTVADQFSVEGETVNVQVLASDPDGDELTYSMNGLPAGFTISETTGVISGTFSDGSAGVYSVNVGVVDGSVGVLRSFTWTVRLANRPPVVVNPGTQNSAEGATLSLPISASDPDGQPLTYSATGLPPGLSINSSSGVISGTLTYAAAGLYTVTVRASDGSLFDEETFTWNVTNTNQAPTASPDSASVVQGQSVVINVLANDTDPDGNGTLSIQGVSTPAQGSVLINSNGTLTYTADPTYTGPVSFSYTITDGTLTSTAQVTVNVQPSNSPPVCSATASAGDLWPPNHKPRYLLLTGITDPDGDAITIRYTGILQDEPVDSVGQGNTPDFDGGIEDDGARAWIRAERTGNPNVPGDGRVYLISYTATDEAGASCSGTTNLGVPHDQRGTPAVLSPGRWNSLNGQQVYAPPPDAVNDVAS